LAVAAREPGRPQSVSLGRAWVGWGWCGLPPLARSVPRRVGNSGNGRSRVRVDQV